MTAEEICHRYGISPPILEEYRAWGLCSEGKAPAEEQQYNDQDLERLSTMMSLHKMGFPSDEIGDYMRLLVHEPAAKADRLRILDRWRNALLDEIHSKEKQLQRMDYLRCELRGSRSREGGAS